MTTATTIEEKPTQFTLRQLTDLYTTGLKLRIAATNRLGAVDRGVDDTEIEEPAPVIASNPLVGKMEDLLSEIANDMGRAAESHPCFEWLMGVPGLNRVTAGRLLGLIPMYEEKDFLSFSKLRKFAGLCPGFNKLIKGQKAPFSKRLRTQLYVVFGSLLKAEFSVKSNKPKRFYGEIYRNWRYTYGERHGVGEKGAEWLYNHGRFPSGNPGGFGIQGESWCWQKKVRCAGCQCVYWATPGAAICPNENVSVADVAPPKHPVVLGSQLGNWRFHIDGKVEKPEWPDKRQHLACFYKVSDHILSHVWLKWRQALGWGYEDFYVHKVLGHHTHSDPSDFSSPELAKTKI